MLWLNCRFLVRCSPSFLLQSPSTHPGPEIKVQYGYTPLLTKHFPQVSLIRRILTWTGAEVSSPSGTRSFFSFSDFFALSSSFFATSSVVENFFVLLDFLRSFFAKKSSKSAIATAVSGFTYKVLAFASFLINFILTHSESTSAETPKERWPVLPAQVTDLIK